MADAKRMPTACKAQCETHAPRMQNACKSHALSTLRALTRARLTARARSRAIDRGRERALGHKRLLALRSFRKRPKNRQTTTTTAREPLQSVCPRITK